MKLFRLVIIGLLLASAPQFAAGIEKQAVPTVTRLVQVFTNLEDTLAASLQQGDDASLSKLVADDFELRIGAKPGNPVPRAEWLQNSHANPPLQFHIEQMAVHDYGATATVSFLWRLTAHHDVFVVDVWSKSGDAWKLSVRFESPAGKPEFPLPGAAPGKPRFKKNY